MTGIVSNHRSGAIPVGNFYCPACFCQYKGGSTGKLLSQKAGIVGNENWSVFSVGGLEVTCDRARHFPDIGKSKVIGNNPSPSIGAKLDFAGIATTAHRLPLYVCSSLILQEAIRFAV